MSKDNSISNKVALEVKKMIIDGKLKAGEQIPSEFELASLFDISRNAVREAIKILVSKNILEIRRGKGTFVSETPGFNDTTLDFDFLDQKKLMKDIIYARLLFEPNISELAAHNASEEEISKLIKISDDMNTLYNSLNDCEDKQALCKELYNLDKEFHYTIAQASGNTFFQHIIPMILSYTQKTLYSDNNFSSAIFHKQIKTTHYQIAKAISDRDGDMAKAYTIKRLKGIKIFNDENDY